MSNNGANPKSNHDALTKRLNFYTGFFTTADDWNQGQVYHLEQRKLHNRALHTPGVIVDQEDHLQVVAAGDQSVEVKAGVALDGAGNLLYLAAPFTLRILPLDTYPAQIYITIEFHEETSDFVENLEDADFNGYTRVTERPFVTWSLEKPDNSTRLELARIDLQNATDPITDPVNSAQPTVHEINCNEVKMAGAVDPVQAQRLAVLEQALKAQKQAYLDRMQYLYTTQLAQQQRHYRGLHRPGIVPDILGELAVAPGGGLNIRIEAGLALDHDGNELYLPEPLLQPLVTSGTQTRFYIAVRYDDTVAQQLNGYLTDLTKPSPACYRTAKLVVTDTEPDNKRVIELARLDLAADATAIKEPIDPHHPQVNELDRRHRKPAGAIGLAPIHLSPELQERFDGLMRSTRDHCAELAQRFPIPTLDDVRLLVMSLQLAVNTVARTDLPHLLRHLAHLELKVAHELAKAYPPLAPTAEFEAYQAMVARLLDALRKHAPLDTILTAQAKVAEAAHTLALVVFPPPVANAGPDQVVETFGNTVIVVLDASKSTAGEKQKIIKYHWEKVI